MKRESMFLLARKQGIRFSCVLEGLSPVVQNQVGGFFSNHDAGGVGIAAGDFRHDGCVGDSQCGDAMDAQAGVYNGFLVSTHAAGGGGMIDGLG